MTLAAAAGARVLSSRHGRYREARSGRHVRSVAVTNPRRPFVLDVGATLKAALSQGGQASASATIPLTVDNARRKVFSRPRQSLVVLLVDASESMASGAAVRMKAARGAALALLTGAYQRRDRVALIAFRGERAEVLLPPTGSVDLARNCLRRLPVGGATPFADGLQQALRLMDNSRRRDPGLIPSLVIVSDGEANVPLTAGTPVVHELRALAGDLRERRIPVTIVDTSSAVGGSKTLRELAERCGGGWQRIRDLDSGQLYQVVLRSEVGS